MQQRRVLEAETQPISIARMSQRLRACAPRSIDSLRHWEHMNAFITDSAR